MRKIKIAEPHNNKHIEMIENFEQKNSISFHASEYLKNIKETITKEQYQKYQYESNEIQQIIYIEENNELKDYCHIQGEKDLKTCRIVLAPIKSKTRTREILSLATNYAFNYLGMNDVFINTNSQQECDSLEKAGFTNLGADETGTIFLKQKEDLIEYNKTI